MAIAHRNVCIVTLSWISANTLQYTYRGYGLGVDVRFPALSGIFLENSSSS